MGILAGCLVEEATSRVREGRLGRSRGRGGRELQHHGKGKVLVGVRLPLVPGCHLHFLLVIFKLFFIPAEVTHPYRGEDPTTEMHLGRGCLGGAPQEWAPQVALPGHCPASCGLCRGDRTWAAHWGIYTAWPGVC